MSNSKLSAGEPFPELNATNLAGETTDIGKPIADADWRIVVVYRGRYCTL